METKVQKWGNSLGVRIPKAFAKEVGVDAGSKVDITVEHGELIIRPGRAPSYSLTDLLRGVTSKNRHEEIETGKPVGKEVW